MIPSGKDYTYNFQITDAGIYYYHCHSSDQHPISYHIHQGLYGAIVVDEMSAPKVDHDWVIMMGEVGPRVTGTGAPGFIMNGIGIPGGEAALMDTYSNRGFDGVKSMINSTLPAFSMKLGETARLSVINIGDQVHSFHVHNIKMISEWYFPGKTWPAEVVQLVPGAADSVFITPTQSGVWLFHCHVVFHADAGMIGVIIVSK
jgi:FtsP/CotA-like multicopper oxidase with cupredoxin domain